MNDLKLIKNFYFENGFAILENIYSQGEIEAIKILIKNADTSKDTFRKSTGLFAIRQFLKEIPEVRNLIFNTKMMEVIHEIFGTDYFITKSIYFDKPADSNWYVAFHQDLTISVDKKLNIPGFQSWTTKQNQFAVQPRLEFLQNNFTIRIHLDDTNHLNGALKVMPESHKKGILRLESEAFKNEENVICNIKAGGLMLMHPLLLHASDRTINNKERRVIHIEFSNMELPENLNWSEKMNIN